MYSITLHQPTLHAYLPREPFLVLCASGYPIDLYISLKNVQILMDSNIQGGHLPSTSMLLPPQNDSLDLTVQDIHDGCVYMAMSYFLVRAIQDLII